jgi:hypothetical protein
VQEVLESREGEDEDGDDVKTVRDEDGSESSAEIETEISALEDKRKILDKERQRKWDAAVALLQECTALEEEIKEVDEALKNVRGGML